MHTERIIKLLSNHRQPHRPQLPQPLSLRAIASLVDHSLSPQWTTNQLSEQLQADLHELQAEGEVLAGTGNRFCMALPTVLAETEDQLTGLRFRGDRAYLGLAHQTLETGQPHSLILHPKIQRSEWIKQHLKPYGIAFLTAEANINHLPTPRLPQLCTLQGFERSYDSFQMHLQTDQRPVQQYVPQKWIGFTQAMLSNRALLRLPTGEFLWFEAGQFYELPPDTAVLAMFELDRMANFSLRIAWDETPGRLDLRRISLPSSYAQMLWWLSQPQEGENRIRLFASHKHPLVHAVFNRLGCILV